MIKTDEQLVELCRRDDLRAFRELLDRYRNKLMAFIYSMVGDYHLAQDIFQETFIRVYRHADRFQDGCKFKPWLYAIAANQCRDELRKLKRRSFLPLGDDGSFEKEGVKTVIPVDKRPGPREIAKAREFKKILEDELGELTPEHREVVIMSRVLGLKYDEIAQVLNIPSGTVRSRLHYSLERLRERLKNKIFPEEKFSR